MRPCVCGKYNRLVCLRETVTGRLAVVVPFQLQN